MRISVITPSIRPKGLETAFRTLQAQTMPRDEWEWLPRLSIPGERPDLCAQVNAALREARGELVVFLQDHIEIGPDALERCWRFHEEHPEACVTMPVGKTTPDGIAWDWRKYREPGSQAKYDEFEIDFGMAPGKAIRKTAFDLRYDDGFGWENVDSAYLMSKEGMRFLVDPSNPAVAFDHDAHETHPYRRKSNAGLWARRKAAIDLMYE